VEMPALDWGKHSKSFNNTNGFCYQINLLDFNLVLLKVLLSLQEALASDLQNFRMDSCNINNPIAICW